MALTYITLAEFKLLSLVPAEVIDAIEQVTPGWTVAQLEKATAHINARLAKRYDVPFSTPYPDVLGDWVARLVSVRCYIRRGVDPTDRQFDMVDKDAQLAQDEIKEASDAIGDAGGGVGIRGMFDLPLRADTTTTGIARGHTRSYSEASPYVGFSKQARTGREEDQSGDGTGG